MFSTSSALATEMASSPQPNARDSPVALSTNTSASQHSTATKTSSNAPQFAQLSTPQLSNTDQYVQSNFVAKDAGRLLVEMFDFETSRYLSKDQLFELARERGDQIPLWVSRGLFKYALGVVRVDKSHELSQQRAQEDEYVMLHKARKTLGERTHVGVWKQLRLNPTTLLSYGHPADPARKQIENILDAIEISFPDVSLVMAKTILLYLKPIAAVNDTSTDDKNDDDADVTDPTKRESDIYFCLKYFIERLREEGQLLHSSNSLRIIAGNFLCHFHSFNQPLYKHFFDNEVDMFDWLPDLLTSLLVGHLPEPQLLILWGYFLMDGLQFHPFVLLAILEAATDDLLELDAEGILTFLRSKPFPLRSKSLLNAKPLFARAKVLHTLANKKEKLQ